MQEESFKHYLTGITAIDLEHRNILDLLDVLRKAVDIKKSEPDINDILSRLVDSWVIHANHEECLMQEVGYPYLEYHKTVHNSMFLMLNKIMKSHKGISTYSVDEIEKTFINHIDGSDLQYVEWYQKKK